MRTANARKSIGIIRHLSSHVPLNTLDELCKMFVRSHLDYCDILYQSFTHLIKSLRKDKPHEMLLLVPAGPPLAFLRKIWVLWVFGMSKYGCFMGIFGILFQNMGVLWVFFNAGNTNEGGSSPSLYPLKLYIHQSSLYCLY